LDVTCLAAFRYGMRGGDEFSPSELSGRGLGTDVGRPGSTV
jgi:hypothetical protein